VTFIGVTRVGVTRAANDGVILFFLEKKTDDLLSHRPLESDDFLAVVSSPLPSFHVVYPVFFLNSATKK